MPTSRSPWRARGDPKTHVSAIMYKYVLAVPNGALLS